jgi:hypothetical protein
MLFTDEELASYPGVEGTPTPATVELLRDIAEAKIYRVIPEDQAINNAEVKGIALEVVARALRNTNGYSSETVDDYTYRRASGTGAAGVYLTDDERATLAGIRTGSGARVRSVRFSSPLTQ